MSSQVPRGEVGTGIVKDLNPREILWDNVKVLLIGESAVFHPVVTPLQATAAPPLRTSDPDFVIAKRYPPDVVNAPGPKDF
jgi:hypothetical protein